MSHPTVADRDFGNKEELTVTLNTPVKPQSPAKPDFTSQAKIFDNEDFGGGEAKNSKSVKVVTNPGNHPVKNIFAAADQTGEFEVEVVLDESELVGGNLVWRKLPGGPQTVAAGVLTVFATELLVRQIRIAYTNGGAAAVVNAWVASLP